MIFLKGYPIRFQRQKAIGDYIVDFYCYKAQLVVGIDGSQHYEDKMMEYDKRRSEKLKLSFSNLDIDKSFKEICKIIDKTKMKTGGNNDEK